jgi:hypothetical protein
MDFKKVNNRIKKEVQESAELLLHDLKKGNATYYDILQGIEHLRKQELWESDGEISSLIIDKAKSIVLDEIGAIKINHTENC